MVVDAFALTPRLGWALLVTAFGTLCNTQMCRALLYPLLYKQASQIPAVPSKPSNLPSTLLAQISSVSFSLDSPASERFADSMEAEGGGGREDEELSNILSIWNSV